MFSLSAREQGQPFRELQKLYWRLEDAINAANDLWQDEDHYYTEIQVNKTVALCTLKRPDPPAEEE